MLIQIGRQMGLTQAEIRQIRSAVGYMSCEGEESGNPATVTGFLVAPDVVVTVAHVFFDRDGEKRAPWEQCFFQTMGESVAKYEVNAISIKVPTDRPMQNRNQDYAVVQLKKPVTHAEPFKISGQPHALAPYDKIYPVSAYRESRYRSGESRHEPLAQFCEVRRIFSPESNGVGSYYSNCDNTSGGSGGPNLVRTRNGLAVAGMFIGAGSPSEDFKPYRESAPVSLSYSLKLEGEFLALVLATVSM